MRQLWCSGHSCNYRSHDMLGLRITIFPLHNHYKRNSCKTKQKNYHRTYSEVNHCINTFWVYLKLNICICVSFFMLFVCMNLVSSDRLKLQNTGKNVMPFWNWESSSLNDLHPLLILISAHLYTILLKKSYWHFITILTALTAFIMYSPMKLCVSFSNLPVTSNKITVFYPLIIINWS